MSKEIDNFKKFLCDSMINGDYEFIKCCEHTATIEIDGVSFSLWISNEPKYHFEFHGNYDFWSTMQPLNTQEKRLKGWRNIKPHIEKYRNDILRPEKMKAFNKLKKELEQ